MWLIIRAPKRGSQTLTHPPTRACALTLEQAGGTTLCQLALASGMAADSTPLPFRQDWTTNCVPYEAFLGPHPAVGGGAMPAALVLPQPEAALPAAGVGAGEPAAAGTAQQRRLSAAAPWLGGACWLGFRTPPQLRAMRAHYAPLTFVASEGPLPDVVPLDALSALGTVTMLRQPLDRALSSYRWWRLMLERMPSSPGAGWCLIAGSPLVQQPECMQWPRVTAELPLLLAPLGRPLQPSATRTAPPPTPPCSSGWSSRPTIG